MPETIEIRESVPEDLGAIEGLYPAAFPDEDLLPLVRSLLRETTVVLSLVAIGRAGLAGRSDVVGHAAFSTCSITHSGATAEEAKVALLAPLAVAPAWQRQGIGKTIVTAGLRRLETVPISHVYVLGDPAYYGRLGFTPEIRVQPPYPLPEEWRGAWQSMGLGGAAPPAAGRLSVPPSWRRPALWSP